MLHALFDKRKHLLEHEINYSQDHEKLSDDTFVPRDFNHGPGGADPITRNNTAQFHSLEPHEHDNEAKPGDQMRHGNADDNPLPKVKECALKFDALDAEKYMTLALNNLKN